MDRPSNSEKAIVPSQPASAADLPEPRTVWWLLAIVTIIAAALRLPFLGHQSLWLDEVFTRDILREPSLSSLWNRIKATESTPPLYYVIGWLVHARSTVAMRLISALALTAAVPVGYMAFRRLIGWRAALATAAILAVDPMLVSYSTDARSYGLFVLTVLLSVWGFAALLEHGSRQRFGLWMLASVASIWTHYFGVFVVGAEVVVLLAIRPAMRLATATWTAVLCVCLIPLVPLVVNQSGDERAEFIAGIPLTKRLSETIRQLAMGPNVPRAWLEASGLVVIGIGVLVGVVMVARSRRPGPRVLLGLAAVVVGAPLLLAVFGIEDRFYARNIIAAVPLVAALAAPAMLRLRATPLALYLVLASVASVWVATNWRYEQVDWKAALARAEAIEPALVVAVTRLGAPVVQTYLGRTPVAPSGVLAQRAWVIVEPIRATGQRALGPAPVPVLPGFSALRTLKVQGFQLVLLSAAKPSQIAVGAGTSVFPGAPTG